MNPHLTEIAYIVLASKVNKSGIQPAEETQFVMLLIFHLHCWYRAIQEGEVSVLEGLESDINNFFSRPIAKHVWSERKTFFDTDFASS